MTPEQIELIKSVAADAAMESAKEVAREAAREAAKEAVHETLTALGFKMDKLSEQQEAMAFNRLLYQFMRRSWLAFFTGIISAAAATLVGYGVYLFTGKHP